MSQVGPKKFYLPGSIPKYSKEIQSFPVRSNDVWVVTVPRSGTTLTQEMVWQICNDLDLQTKIPLYERFPFFDFSLFQSREKMLEIQKGNPELSKKVIEVTTLPWDKEYDPKVRRFFKTHIPLLLLPSKLLTSDSKIVYVARNLPDVLVSTYHHQQMLGMPVPEKFEQFWALAKEGKQYSYPYFDHILEAWNLRHHKNLLFLFYEDIVMKPEETIKKTAQFFNKNLNENQINQLKEHIKFENFKNNNMVRIGYGEIMGLKKINHIRRGKVGSSKDEFFSDELREEVAEFIKENLKNTDLKFPIF